MTLKRSISTFGLLFVAVGGMVGSGWLFGPFYAARLAGPISIFSWILGGVLMLLIALTFAELGTSFPFAGSTIHFLKITHGPSVGFIIAWMLWISSIAVAPVETLALIHYASIYIPGMMHNINQTHVLTSLGLVIAIMLMLVMCTINSMGAGSLLKTNNFMVSLKLAVPVLTAIVILSFDFHASNLTSHGIVPQGLKGLLISLPSAGIVFSFLGYGPAIQLAGEVKNPKRSIPIALIGAMLICIVLYILLQLAFIGALQPNSIHQGWNALAFQSDAGPFAGIALGIGAFWLVKILYADAVISPFGTALVYTASTARVFYAMANYGYFPKSLMKLNRFGMPTRIIAINFLLGSLLFLPFPTWQNMMVFLVSVLVFSYVAAPLALTIFRKSLPNHKRPFCVPAAKWVCLAAFYICNLIIYWSGWNIVSKMLIAVGLGFVMLAIYKLTSGGRKLKLELLKAWWLFLYIILIGVVSYMGSFNGGLGVIAFGWDFLIIALVSMFVFEIAIRCPLSKKIIQEQVTSLILKHDYECGYRN